MILPLFIAQRWIGKRRSAGKKEGDHWDSETVRL
jgi:hypothetical protein